MEFSPAVHNLYRKKFAFCKVHRFIKELKSVLFDVALLILFVIALIRFIKTEAGW
jgi:hypothetical protein